MVVGAGVTGLQVAELTAKRGHHVTVYEKAKKQADRFFWQKRFLTAMRWKKSTVI